MLKQPKKRNTHYYFFNIVFQRRGRSLNADVSLTLFYVAMHWGARSLHGKVDTQPDTQPTKVFLFHVAVQRSVRSLYGDVVAVLCRRAPGRSPLAWRCS